MSVVATGGVWRSCRRRRKRDADVYATVRVTLTFSIALLLPVFVYFFSYACLTARARHVSRTYPINMQRQRSRPRSMPQSNDRSTVYAYHQKRETQVRCFIEIGDTRTVSSAPSSGDSARVGLVMRHVRGDRRYAAWSADAARAAAASTAPTLLRRSSTPTASFAAPCADGGMRQ